MHVLLQEGRQDHRERQYHLYNRYEQRRLEGRVPLLKKFKFRETTFYFYIHNQIRVYIKYSDSVENLASKYHDTESRVKILARI